MKIRLLFLASISILSSAAFAETTAFSQMWKGEELWPFQAAGSVQNVGRMERWFYYFNRFVNAGPSQPTSRFGSGKELTEFDGSLRANGVALCIASHFVEGAMYVGSVELDPSLQLHVFKKAASSVGFLWSRPEKPLKLNAAAKELRFFDIMGNTLPGGPFDVSNSPIYFTFNGDPEACQSALKAIIDSRVTKATAKKSKQQDIFRRGCLFTNARINKVEPVK